MKPLTHIVHVGTIGALLVATPAFAQGTGPGTGAPPSDVGQSVAAPTNPSAAPPKNPKKDDVTSLALAAGGQFATGNSRSIAVSGQAKFDLRRKNNELNVAAVGNYADGYVFPSGTTPGAWKETVENVQGKLRYDRFFTSQFSAFLQLTGTHDSFQALTFRLNVDPGAKYVFVDEKNTKFWGELGYDFQFDDNYTDDNGFEQAGPGGQVLDANNLPYVIAKTDTIHSTRAYAGFVHDFNKHTQLSVGLEYLQGLGGQPGGLPVLPAGYTTATATPVAIPLTPARLNFSMLFTAKVGAGFAVGAGFIARYTSEPLPGKEPVDTTTTLTLIYSYTAEKNDKKPEDKDKK
jgi:hypothetical protein